MADKPQPYDLAHTDDPRQAMESGEPEAQGTTRGHVVNERSDKVEGTSDPKAKAGDNKDWESGRQQAQ